MKMAAVVAHDRERGIGRGGDLPWRLPGEMKYFVSLTTRVRDPGAQNAVLMGHATYESIPARFRPLKGRRNIVLSRREDLALEGAVVAGDWQSAKAAAAGCERVFVIGGAQIYRLALADPECRELYITRVEGEFGCDTVLADYRQSFEMAEDLGTGEDGGIAYRFERWIRSAS